jgi:hypothetical protein
LRRPVVATPAAETRRLASGWAYFGVTVDDWVRAIEHIVHTPAAAADRAAQGYAHVAEHYRWDHLAARLEEHIMSIRPAGSAGEPAAHRASRSRGAAS